MKLFRKLSHPNIIKFFGPKLYQGEVGLVMEYGDQNLKQFYEELHNNSDSMVCLFILFSKLSFKFSFPPFKL